MYFELYQQTRNALSIGAGAEDWRWRLKAANHEIVAQGEGYRNKTDCLHAVNLLKQTTMFTPVRG